MIGGSCSTHESPLRRGRSGEPKLGRRARSEARTELEEAGQALQKRRVVGRLERKVGGKRVSDGRRAVLTVYPAKARRACVRALPDIAAVTS